MNTSRSARTARIEIEINVVNVIPITTSRSARTARIEITTAVDFFESAAVAVRKDRED